jgi:hypothetical protein
VALPWVTFRPPLHPGHTRASSSALLFGFAFALPLPHQRPAVPFGSPTTPLNRKVLFSQRRRPKVEPALSCAVSVFTAQRKRAYTYLVLKLLSSSDYIIMIKRMIRRPKSDLRSRSISSLRIIMITEV